MMQITKHSTTLLSRDPSRPDRQLGLPPDILHVVRFHGDVLLSYGRRPGHSANRTPGVWSPLSGGSRLYDVRCGQRRLCADENSTEGFVSEHHGIQQMVHTDLRINMRILSNLSVAVWPCLPWATVGVWRFISERCWASMKTTISARPW